MKYTHVVCGELCSVCSMKGICASAGAVAGDCKVFSVHCEVCRVKCAACHK